MMHLVRLFVLSLWGLAMAPAWAHKGSDAYLDVQTAGPGGARWSLTLAVAVKDLDLVVPLDADADGKVTWGEVKAALPLVRELLQAHTGIAGDGVPDPANAAACGLAWRDAGMERRSDGVYLRFNSTADCGGTTRLQYTLLRAQDPTHRLLVTGLVDGQPLLSTWSPLQPGGLPLRRLAAADGIPVQGGPATLWRYLQVGVQHLLQGYDHLAFLLALVLPLRLVFAGRGTLPVPQPGAQGALRWAGARAAPHAGTWGMLLRTITAFTIGHSVTLILATLGWTKASPSWVEPAIAVTIACTALLNIYPVRGLRTDVLALFFGMVHGYGFASLLTEAEAPAGLLPWALAGFNLGIECGQLLAVAGWVLVSQPLVRRMAYDRVVVRWGSWALVLLSAFWFWERVV